MFIFYLFHIFRRLTNNDFSFIVDKIIELFPKEKKEVYYVPPIRKRNSIDGRSGIAKGKLIDKYRNTLTFLREAKLLPSLKHSNDELETDTDSVGNKTSLFYVS